MKQLNDIFNFLKTIQRVLKIQDSIAVSLFSGFLGTLVMDTSNLLFWKKGKSEVLYGHIGGSVFVRPFRTNQSKNYWLGQITHQIMGSVVAIPLYLILKLTGKDHHILKGLFFGSIAWEFIYGIGQRSKLFAVKPHLTKTHFSMLLNHFLYGITVAQALVTFTEPSVFPDVQSKKAVQDTRKNTVQPIYSDTNYQAENSDAYEIE